MVTGGEDISIYSYCYMVLNLNISYSLSDHIAAYLLV